MIQLGQQFQDVAVQAQMGTSAFTIFAQQGSQVGFALSGMRGKLGQVGTYLAGPWGVALTLGVVAAGKIYDALNKVADASDLAKIGANGLSDAQSVLGNVFDTTSGKLKSQNELLIANARLTAINLRSEALQQKTTSGKAFAEAGKVDPLSIPLSRLLTLDRGRSLNEYLSKGTPQADLAKRYQSGQISGPDALQAAAKLDFKGLKVERDKFLQAFIDDLSADAKKLVADQIDKSLNTGVLAGGLREPGRSPGRAKPVPMTRGEVEGILKEMFPGVQITGRGRSPTSALGRANPDSYHNVDQALDFARPAGVSIEDVKKRLVGRGVDVKEALDEYANPSKHATGPHYHIAFAKQRLDGEQAVARAIEVQQEETDRLGKVADQVAAQVGRIGQQFASQPTLIERSRSAVQALDEQLAILATPANSKAPGLERLVTVATSARAVAFDAVGRELDRQTESDRDALDLVGLRLAGRREEAEVLQSINAEDDKLGLSADVDRLRDELGVRQSILAATEAGSEAQEAAKTALDGTAAELARIEALQGRLTQQTVDRYLAEQNTSRELARQSEASRRQLAVVDQARAGLEDFVSGKGTGALSGLKDTFQQFRSEAIVERLFGPALKELEAYAARDTPLGQATERFVTSSDRSTAALDKITVAARDAAASIAGTSAPVAADGSFVVQGGRAANDNTTFLRRTAEAGAGSIVNQLNAMFGTEWFTKLQGSVAGGLEGLATAGPIGALLGVAKDLPGLPKATAESLGKVFESGAGGYQSALILKSLGVNSSGAGGALGGAIGGGLAELFGKSLGDVSKFLGPVGGLIGSLAGPLLGGLFKKAKFGGASIGGIGGSLGVTGTVGNSGAAKRGGSEAADSVIGNLDRIAEQLNASVDASKGFVTVGSYDGKARVNTEGTTLGGSKSPVKGLKDFGDDTDAAIRYAVLDLINDGVLVGLRAGTQRLLQNAKDLESGLADALKFENVFTRLKAYRDPVGAAMDTLDREFTRLQGIFGKAGASTGEYADLEALYGIERAKIIKDEGERITATLRGLLNDLTVNNDARSLRNRLAEAQTVYDPLKARVESGDRTAYDEFAVAARAMLDLQRQIYGSSSAYFSSLDDVTALTRKRIEGETNLVAITDGRDSPFTASGAAKDSTVTAIEAQTDAFTTAIQAQTDALTAAFGSQNRVTVASNSGGAQRDFRPAIAARAF